MPRIIRMLNMDYCTASIRRRRVWLDTGVPVVVGPGLVFRLFFDAYDEVYTPNVLLQGPGIEFKADLPMGCWLDMSDQAGMMAMPRAAEINQHGRITRVLMEFIAVRPDVHLAAQTQH